MKTSSVISLPYLLAREAELCHTTESGDFRLSEAPKTMEIKAAVNTSLYLPCCSNSLGCLIFKINEDIYPDI